ncbi:hypothetical protein B9Q03_01755 [Candidatus Marsarchaeota G2 archaeon OSP_D]|jgi:hypothetical protein|uniref:Uncharacterized protein n=2 Tax=Candidatus Marsarchaeota group 2 TaxID=2203771 RepID=A0A2R6AYG1_9ARCH|nr:MAG: hypothetical protein B9Q08_03035 [Candidatus Marsarchaeota G2 archaeon ECH_B_SAG-M15]PSN92272.1 MAG: hypothetical protein B9Q03_01755 [Candidatus Marsarchaeota G2 archaeon OSP_D]
MVDCLNVRTIFSLTRISTFCVEIKEALKVLDELLQAVGTEWAQEAILEVVSNYGKQAVMPGDVTVGVLTIVVSKNAVEYAGVMDQRFLSGIRSVCEANGYTLSVSG